MADEEELQAMAGPGRVEEGGLGLRAEGGGGGGGGGDEEDYGDGGEGGEDVRTDVELLRRVWSNEKAAPEILPYEAHLVERVREQVLLMEENIEAFSAETSDELMLSLYRMDVDRTLFLLRSYLRTRLSKIEKYPVHITSTPELSGRLSDNELDYAYRYGETIAKHLEQTVLNRLPEHYQSMSRQATSSEEDDMIPRPQLDTFVFCKSKANIGSTQMDDMGDEIVDLMEGDLHILLYKPVRRLLETKRIDLI